MTTRAIDQSGDVWLYRPSQHKGSHLGRLLTKAIPPIAQQILLPLLREDLDEPIFSPIDSKAYFRDLQHPVRVITPERALVALHLQRQGKLLPEIAAELGCSRSSASALIQMGKEASGARKRKRSRSALKKSAAKGHQRTFYTTASYGKSIRYAIQRAAKVGESIPHWAPNQLRHSVATRLRSTSGIEAAQIYLGHSEPDTTLIYAEQTEEALIEIARDFALPLGEHRRPKHESH